MLYFSNAKLWKVVKKRGKFNIFLTYISGIFLNLASYRFHILKRTYSKFHANRLTIADLYKYIQNSCYIYSLYFSTIFYITVTCVFSVGTYQFLRKYLNNSEIKNKN